MNVKDIMTPEIYVCHINDSLDKIAMMMWNQNCGAIAVINDKEEPIGIVTDRDIAMSCALNHKAPWELQTETILGEQALAFAMEDDTVEDALAVMKERKVRRLPVVNEDYHLTGILSIDDVIYRSKKGKSVKNISYDTTMETLKVVTLQS